MVGPAAIPAVAAAVAAGVAAATALAELLHARRSRRLGTLAFGPGAVPRPWARTAPLLRTAAAAALAWGLTTLLLIDPKVYKPEVLGEEEYRHIVLVLDVSPSMKLEDAGPALDQSRSKRAAEVLESFFKRVVIEQMRLSVVAVYNGAKPVVVDTRDVEVVRNILNDLPMNHAFSPGKTKLFEGLEVAADIARPWRSKSTTLILVTDGDTVPATGMPKMPPAVSEVLVVGVGDPRAGSFIDGYLSRQDTATLRQIARRLGGIYHDGNQKHLGTATLKELTEITEVEKLKKLTAREYALAASGAGGALLALLPLALTAFGSGWRPGVRGRRGADGSGVAEPGKIQGSGLPGA